jgi:WS/DGAT/MGAT family acyltransferase
VAKTLSFFDKAFWLTETVHNPKHVASLQLLTLPENAGSNYLDELIDEMRSFNQPVYPFNSKVKAALGYPIKLIPSDMDMHYHVQSHEIENVSDLESLHQYASTLHETLLDRDKPLWQFHVIKSKQGRDFSIYVKIHHMIGDGATMVRWLQEGYLEEVNSENFVPVWAMQRKRRSRQKSSKVKSVLAGLWGTLITIKDLLLIFIRHIFKAIRLNRHYMPIPFTGTKTVLTGQVKQGRVISTCDLDFDRVQRLSKRARATINEVLLCSFDIGVHRFLMDYGHTFKRALYTNMPINLRAPGDDSGGNQIAIVPVKLAHGSNDPYLRLRQIIENHRIVKNAAKKATPMAFSYYTVIIQTFALIFEQLHITDWMRPIANILISNVPGPREARYLKECRLKAIYPISTITPGGGVNITLLTYDKTANIGIVACDRSIKSLEPLADYFVEAFDMLERCIDNPDLNIEDIGEKIEDVDKAIVLDAPDEDQMGLGLVMSDEVEELSVASAQPSER